MSLPVRVCVIRVCLFRMKEFATLATQTAHSEHFDRTAHADLKLRLAHMSEGTISDVACFVFHITITQ